jgi:hypothetical protein
MDEKNSAWETDSAAYADTIAAYEALLSQPFEPKDEKYRSASDVNALSFSESQLPEKTKEVLIDLGFRPVVGERSTVDALKIDVLSETWADESGGTTAEFSLGIPKHFVSTYFVDGRVISIWPSDSAMIGKPAELRIIEGGTGDLRKDIERALQLREERGTPTLKYVDAKTAGLREEYSWRFIRVDPVAFAMANPDMKQVRKLILNWFLKAVGLVVLVAVVVTLVWGIQPYFLGAVAVLLAMLVWSLFGALKKDGPADLSREDVEKALRMMEEMDNAKKD